tara:strand:+ start:207 stop:356 length:150 start_codon:yes stop_codon:yes gene_type:complete
MNVNYKVAKGKVAKYSFKAFEVVGNVTAIATCGFITGFKGMRNKLREMV